MKAFGIILFWAQIGWAQGLLPVIQDLPGRDQDFACTSQAKADQYTKEFSIDTRSFGGIELCRPDGETKKLFNDLQIIEEGKFGADPRSNLIRGFIPAQNYYSWMRSQTRGVQRGNDVPYATAYNSGGYFTMQDGWKQLSTLGRVGTIIHEARHTAGYGHTPCSQGPYGGLNMPGCDRDVASGGSHAVEMEYYARVSLVGENFHPVYKKMARLMAMGRANFVFNQNPLRQAETLMIVSPDGQLAIWDGSQWIQRESTQAGGTLKRTSFGASLVNGKDVWALDPYANSGFNWLVADDYSYFKLLASDRGLGTSGWKDFEEVDLGTKRYFMALLSPNRFASYGFRQGTWGAATPVGQNFERFVTVSPSGQKGLFALTPDQRIWSINTERINQSAEVREQWDSSVKSYLKLNQTIFLHRKSGDLFELKAGQEVKISTPFVIDQVVTIPIYDTFEVFR